MSATVLSVKKVTSKFNNAPAFRFDLLTEKGIKSKTVNEGSREYNLITQLFGSPENSKGKKVGVDLIPNPYKKDWFNVYFKR
jgi:hypothetical protein